MPPSIYLAKLLGPALAAAGSGMLLNPSAYAAMVSDMLDDPALIYVASVTWIVAMRAMQTFWAPLLDFPAFGFVGGIIVLLLGAVLCYFGYRASKPIGREK